MTKFKVGDQVRFTDASPLAAVQDICVGGVKVVTIDHGPITYPVVVEMTDDKGNTMEMCCTEAELEKI